VDLIVGAGDRQRIVGQIEAQLATQER
jgi:hypothetical protein